MPLYEYYCPDCKSKFEMLVSYQHADEVVCTKCRSEKVRRLLSVFARPVSASAGEDDGYDDMPSMGSCGCGGDCGCH
ncbi:MAG TPA: zinc ribbon domain-containing protein [Ktedonobacteraceae bacterium]|nr:zinc ribbon domain-containing protein [Ktedonobacteraceae bacterium]